jgi:hypothetical protein
MRAAANAEAEREVIERAHAANQKHNERLRRQGIPGRFECPPQCYICHPLAVAQAATHEGLSTVDLRGADTGPKVVLRGKRGKCRGCGAKIRRNRWYCDDCKLHPGRAKLTPPPRRCGFCATPLPETAPATRKWCGDSCKRKAYRARHGR